MSLSYGYHMGMLWLSYGMGLTMGHVWGVIGTGMDLEWSGKRKWAKWKGEMGGVERGRGRSEGGVAKCKNMEGKRKIYE